MPQASLYRSASQPLREIIAHEPASCRIRFTLPELCAEVYQKELTFESSARVDQEPDPKSSVDIRHK